MEHLEQKLNIDISPLTDFTPGIEFHTNIRVGDQYDAVVSECSSKCKSSPFSFGVKLGLLDENMGTQAVELLNGLKDGFLGADEKAKHYLENGVSVDISSKGKNILINVHVDGATAEKMNQVPGWSQLDLGNTKYSGKIDFSLATGFNPTKLLTAQVEDVVDMSTLFKIKGDGVCEEMHHVLNTLKVLISNVGILPEKEQKMVCSALSVLTCMRDTTLVFKYDPTVIKGVAGEVLGHSGKKDEASGFMSSNQEMAKGMLPMAQGFVPMITQFAPPELVKSVNLDDYEIQVCIPKARFHLNVGFSLNGLTSFIKDNIIAGSGI